VVRTWPVAGSECCISWELQASSHQGVQCPDLQLAHICCTKSHGDDHHAALAVNAADANGNNFSTDCRCRTDKAINLHSTAGTLPPATHCSAASWLAAYWPLLQAPVSNQHSSTPVYRKHRTHRKHRTQQKYAFHHCKQYPIQDTALQVVNHNLNPAAFSCCKAQQHVQHPYSRPNNLATACQIIKYTFMHDYQRTDNCVQGSVASAPHFSKWLTRWHAH